MSQRRKRASRKAAQVVAEQQAHKAMDDLKAYVKEHGRLPETETDRRLEAAMLTIESIDARLRELDGRATAGEALRKP